MVTVKLRPTDRKRVMGEVGWRCIFHAEEVTGLNKGFKIDRIWQI